ncbi:MAG: 4-alpha-glucanotransferase [Candidatus Binataceae bacterium]
MPTDGNTPNPLPRAAGVLIPLFSLRTDADLGRGEILDLIPFVDFALAMRHRVVQLLPLNETSPGEASPYNALSVFAIDPLYISLNAVFGITAADVDQARATIGSERADRRRRIREAKLPILERSFRQFVARAGAEDRAALDRFVDLNRGWLQDYALFRALKERLGWKSWEDWPEDLKSRDAAALAAARGELAGPIDMYAYWQFIAHRQWAEARAAAANRGVLIGGDLSFSPARDSAEVWANQQLFRLDRSVGAPPDGFNPKGQRWGLPMPDWVRMRSDNFAWWRGRVRDACSLYDLFRIDHVVGLYRTFSFDLNSDQPGEYWPAAAEEQREQGEAFIRMVKDEAHGTLLIAEDLGAVPAWVRESLTSFGIPGYKVMRWEKEKKDPADANEHYVSPADYPELSLATTGTHDTETFAEWWREVGEAGRADLAESLGLKEQIDPRRPALADAELEAILEKLYQSPARLVVVPIQDLFGWETRINFPGTVRASNWAYRLPAPIERMGRNGQIRARIANLTAIVERTGR